MAISNPSKYSSEGSKDDAAELAKNLGLDYRVVPIQPMVDPFLASLGLTGVAEENLQARVRGVIWMGVSNQEGPLVLANSNKSEVSVGYSTIYGDSVGGFAPIKDVPKTLVWELASWRNRYRGGARRAPPIPEATITKPPSAELRPGQTDQDSLPPYEILDAILAGYVGVAHGRERLIADGFDPANSGQGHPARRPRGVEAAPVRTRPEDLTAGVRQGPAAADHQPVAGRGPGPVVTTPVQLRPWSADDLPVLERNNTPEMTVHLGGPESPEKVRDRHERYQRHWLEGTAWMFTARVDDEPVGLVGYWNTDPRGPGRVRVRVRDPARVPGSRSRGGRDAGLPGPRRTARDARRRLRLPEGDQRTHPTRCAERLGFVLEGEQDFEYPKGHPIRANAWRYALGPLRQATSSTEGA